MRHDIPTLAALKGHGAWARNEASAICARYAIAADTFFSHPFFRWNRTSVFRAFTGGIINKDSGQRLTPDRLAGWRNTNDNAYAYRRAAPGRNPGRGRHREPDRGI